MVTVGFTGRVFFFFRKKTKEGEGGSCVVIQGKHSKQKGPEAEEHLAYLKNSKEDGEGGAGR